MFSLSANAFRPRVTVSVTPNGTQPQRKNVSKETPDELNPGNRLRAFGVAVAPVLPEKRDRRIRNLQNAGIANGRAAHISPEVFDQIFAIAAVLNVDTPILVPDAAACKGVR